MVRVGLFLLGCASLALLIGPFVQVIANPATEPETSIRNTLAIQCAMEKASYLLLQCETKKAVEVLEESLARVNGKHEYLKLLRKAYRTYIQELWVANQTSLAQQYLERLSILDSTAASDPTLRPTPRQKNFSDSSPLPQTAATGPAKIESTGPPDAVPLPKPAEAKTASVLQTLPGPKPTTARGKIEDPFDLSYENAKQKAQNAHNAQLANSLLAKAEAEYAQQRFAPAYDLFLKANQADPKVVVGTAKDRWIYCRLHLIVEELNRQNLDSARLPGLRSAVQDSLAMNPAPKLADTARWLLKQIEDRQKGVPAQVTAEPVAVQHHSRNAQGWQIAETANFRVYHTQGRDFAEKAARIAEQTRTDMFRKWFSSPAEAWNPKCELYLHTTANDYSRVTGVPSNSPGHSRIENDRLTGRIVGRRMDLHCENPTLLQAILPHETTHVVLAGQFGRHAVPRWADEGMAVLTEPADKIEQHRRNLLRSRQEGQLFSVRELMTLQEYPNGRRIGAFYAQSVVLVEFMSKLRGPQVFSQFLRDGLNDGYETALRKHYNVRDFNELQERWTQDISAQLTDVNAAGYAGQVK